MIFKLLTNANYFIYYLVILFVFMLVAYLIYKIFIIENDLYYLNQKINKMEIEFNNPNGLSNVVIDKQENFNMNEIIMNEIFNSESEPEQKNINEVYCDLSGTCHVNNSKIINAKILSQPEHEIITENAIDIDNILNDVCNNDNDNNDTSEKKEVIFDLKKEVINDDKESIISSNALTKKKLQKLNLDKLKEKCVELAISQDGSKAQLIDRIMESSTL